MYTFSWKNVPINFELLEGLTILIGQLNILVITIFVKSQIRAIRIRILLSWISVQWWKKLLVDFQNDNTSNVSKIKLPGIVVLRWIKWILTILFSNMRRAGCLWEMWTYLSWYKSINCQDYVHLLFGPRKVWDPCEESTLYYHLSLV